MRSVSKISFLFCLPAVNIWRFRVLLRDVLRGREERSGDVEGDLVAVVDHQETHVHNHLTLATILDLGYRVASLDKHNLR